MTSPQEHSQLIDFQYQSANVHSVPSVNTGSSKVGNLSTTSLPELSYCKTTILIA